MLICYLTRRRLTAYLGGALETAATPAVERHLTGCVRCQREAEQLRRLRTALWDSAAMVAPPDWTGFWPGIVRGVEAAEHRAPARPVSRHWGPLRRPALAFGGALAAALVLSLTLWQVFDRPPVRTMVVSANTEAPEGTVMVYSTPEHDMAVVWVFGAD